jgi:hypothetical protein
VSKIVSPGDKEMKKAGCSIIIFFIVFMQACSTKQVYDSMQYNQRLECKKAPFSEYDECIERANESYEEYKLKREDAIGGQ